MVNKGMTGGKKRRSKRKLAERADRGFRHQGDMDQGRAGEQTLRQAVSYKRRWK